MPKQHAKQPRRFLSEVSSLSWFLRDTLLDVSLRLRGGKKPFPLTSFFSQTYVIGTSAVVLIGTVSALLGATTALLIGYQLRKYGASSLVPGIVTVTFVRELGSLLLGIIVAARSGSAFAAELGAMRISDEVEALEGMGIGPLRYLVAPRLIAMVLMMPCLWIVSCLGGLLGGAIVTKLQLGISWVNFTQISRDYLEFKDIFSGIVKSGLFGFVITMISCYRGLTVEGGSAGVGKVTSSSVVVSIGTVIVVDTIVNILWLGSGGVG